MHEITLVSFLIIIILFALCSRLYNKIKMYKEENDFLAPKVTSSRKKEQMQCKNRTRIKSSKVPFDNQIFGEILVIEDTLDIEGNTGITIYTVDSNVEIFFIKDLHEIAKIDLHDESYDEKKKYKIEKLKVDEKYRRKGIATKLLQRVVEWALLRNIDELTLFPSAAPSISQENLINFYLKNGFVYGEREEMKMEFNHHSII